jgi:hypothetical protein
MHSGESPSADVKNMAKQLLQISRMEATHWQINRLSGENRYGIGSRSKGRVAPGDGRSLREVGR